MQPLLLPWPQLDQVIPGTCPPRFFLFFWPVFFLAHKGATIIFLPRLQPTLLLLLRLKAKHSVLLQRGRCRSRRARPQCESSLSWGTGWPSTARCLETHWCLPSTYPSFPPKSMWNRTLRGILTWRTWALSSWRTSSARPHSSLQSIKLHRNYWGHPHYHQFAHDNDRCHRFFSNFDDDLHSLTGGCSHITSSHF